MSLTVKLLGSARGNHEEPCIEHFEDSASIRLVGNIISVFAKHSGTFYIHNSYKVLITNKGIIIFGSANGVHICHIYLEECFGAKEAVVEFFDADFTISTVHILINDLLQGIWNPGDARIVFRNFKDDGRRVVTYAKKVNSLVRIPRNPKIDVSDSRPFLIDHFSNIIHAIPEKVRNFINLALYHEVSRYDYKNGFAVGKFSFIFESGKIKLSIHNILVAYLGYDRSLSRFEFRLEKLLYCMGPADYRIVRQFLLFVRHCYVVYEVCRKWIPYRDIARHVAGFIVSSLQPYDN